MADGQNGAALQARLASPSVGEEIKQVVLSWIKHDLPPAAQAQLHQIAVEKLIYTLALLASERPSDGSKPQGDG